MAHSQIVYELAAVLMAYDECDAEDTRENFQSWFRHWSDVLPKMAQEGHGGDCTKASGACMRCHHDAVMVRAAALSAYLETD